MKDEARRLYHGPRLHFERPSVLRASPPSSFILHTCSDRRREYNYVNALRVAGFLQARRCTVTRKAIGILTSGGDCPGLNAAIRGVGKSARDYFGMQVIGFQDGFRGLVENRTVRLEGDMLSGIIATGGTILGTSRDKPHRMPVGNDTYMDMTDGGHRQLPQEPPRRADLPGRRRDAEERPAPRQARPEHRHPAQDDRQRRGRDGRDLRLRHGHDHRRGGHRPAAHHRGQPSPRDRGGDHGPQRRLAGAGRGPGRRRGRDPDPGDPLSDRLGGRGARVTRHGRASGSASSPWPRARCRWKRPRGGPP